MAGFASGLEAGLQSLEQGQRARAAMGLQQQQLGLESLRTNADLQNTQIQQQRQQNKDALDAYTQQINDLHNQAFPYMATVAAAKYIPDPAKREAYINGDEFKNANTALQPIDQQLTPLVQKRQEVLGRIANHYLDQAQQDAQAVVTKRAMGLDPTPDEYANYVAYSTKQDPKVFLPGPNGEPSIATQHVANVAQAFQTGNFDSLKDSDTATFFAPQLRAMIGQQFPGGGVVTGVKVHAVHYDPNNPQNLIVQPLLTVQRPDGSIAQGAPEAFGDHAFSIPAKNVMAKIQQTHDIAQDVAQSGNAQTLANGTSFFDQLQSHFGAGGVDPRAMQLHKYELTKDGRIAIYDYAGNLVGTQQLPLSDTEKADINLKNSEAGKNAAMSDFYRKGGRPGMTPYTGSDGKTYTFDSDGGQFVDSGGNAKPDGIVISKVGSGSAGQFGGRVGELSAALAVRGVSLPAGLRSKDQQLGAFQGLLNKYPDKSADDIADMVRTGQLDFNGAKRTTGQLATVAGATNTAAKQLDKNFAALDPLVAKMGTTSVPIIDRAFAQVRQNWESGGDKDTAQFIGLLRAVAGEYAKIRSGGTGAAAPPESEMKDAMQVMNNAFSKGGYEGLKAAIQTEAANKRASYQEGLREAAMPGAGVGNSQGAGSGAPALPAGWSIKKVQ
jgi:hypothetical protein